MSMAYNEKSSSPVHCNLMYVVNLFGNSKCLSALLILYFERPCLYLYAVGADLDPHASCSLSFLRLCIQQKWWKARLTIGICIISAGNPTDISVYPIEAERCSTTISTYRLSTTIYCTIPHTMSESLHSFLFIREFKRSKEAHLGGLVLNTCDIFCSFLIVEHSGMVLPSDSLPPYTACC